MVQVPPRSRGLPPMKTPVTPKRPKVLGLRYHCKSTKGGTQQRRLFRSDGNPRRSSYCCAWPCGVDSGWKPGKCLKCLWCPNSHMENPKRKWMITRGSRVALFWEPSRSSPPLDGHIAGSFPAWSRIAR